MDTDERRRADALDHYWDAVVRSDPVRDRPLEVGDLTDTILQRLQSRRTSPSLDPARERVWRTVDAEFRPLIKEIPMNGTVPRTMRSASLPVRSDRSMPGSPARGNRWAQNPVASISLVALLLVTAVLAWVAIGPPRSGDPGRGGKTLPGLVSIQATPAPTSIVLRARVGSVAGGSPRSGFNRNTLAPGAEVAMTTELIFVEQGSLVFTSKQPAEVVRANGTTETTTPGAGATLGAGDGAGISFADAGVNSAPAADGPVRMRNTGTTPVIFLDAAIGAEGSSTAFFRGFDAKNIFWVDHPPVTFPVEIALRQVTLAPNESVAPPDGGVILISSVDGSGTLAGSDDGSYRNIGAKSAAFYVVTIAPLAEGAATPAASG